MAAKRARTRSSFEIINVPCLYNGIIHGTNKYFVVQSYTSFCLNVPPTPFVLRYSVVSSYPWKFCSSAVGRDFIVLIPTDNKTRDYRAHIINGKNLFFDGAWTVENIIRNKISILVGKCLVFGFVFFFSVFHNIPNVILFHTINVKILKKKQKNSHLLISEYFRYCTVSRCSQY